ncbi:MAG: ABC transporter permease, partial [Rhizobiaceae bacterium]|nr:ABC transporter permease [Rhizobiaceae bacterium]
MKAYIARKLFALPLILIGVSLLVFLAIRALPGDPARLMAGPEATQAAVDDMRARLGLDRSLVAQYVDFAYGAMHGDLGMSIKSKLPVVSEIGERLPYTIALAMTSYLLAILVGVPAGMAGAIFRR